MNQAIVLSNKDIEDKIYYIRNLKVMLDSDLAALYGVETRILNQAIARNAERFPEDFMFTLTPQEWNNLISQNETSSWGGRRKLPNVFTEHGVLMLSSVLNSDRAVKVNIQIIRVFTKMRELILTHKDILLKLEQLEAKGTKHDEQIQLIFKYLKKLLQPPAKPVKKVSYKDYEAENKTIQGKKKSK